MKSSLTNMILSSSPYIEIIVRYVYWLLVQNFPTMSVKRRKRRKVHLPADFNKICQYLIDSGIAPGDILIVHSSYNNLRGTNMSPEGIISSLLGVVGSLGTLVMPAMPLFRNAPKKSDYLRKVNGSDIYEYDVNKTPIKTGALASSLFRMQGSYRSRHPINTVVAVGAHASYLVKDNVVSEESLACGTTSSWYKALKKNAVIVGLGVDLTHSLTMIHVAEDVNSHWPIKHWYRRRKFRIIDGDFKLVLNLKERHPKWGALHFAERTLCKDLLRENILKRNVIDGIQVEIINSEALYEYLNERNMNGYPYWLTAK